MLLHNRGTRNTLPCNTSRALLALLLLLPGPLLAQVPIVTGDCAGGARATVTSGSWGQGEQFRCTTTGDIQLGSHIEASNGSQVTLISNQIRIVAPVTIRAGANFHARTLSSLRVSDTGIRRCSSGLPLPILSNGEFGECPQPDFRRQDAEFRGDQLATNFTRIEGTDGVPELNFPPKTLCLTDNTTGLMWEGKISYEFRPSRWNDTFTWYNPDAAINGGSSGMQDPGPTCYNYQPNEPGTYCNTHAYVARVNREGLCGFHDWRLPTIKELEGILSYEKVMSQPDPEHGSFFFAALPHSLDDIYQHANMLYEIHHRTFWAATPAARSRHYAWLVDFIEGESRIGEKEIHRSIRLVRGGH